MPALGEMLDSLCQVVSTKEHATFAFRRVSSFFKPTEGQHTASDFRALEAALNGLMALIQNENDANLALERISNMIVSFAANPVTSQESDSSQQATSSSPSSSSSSAASSLPQSAHTQQAAAPTTVLQPSSAQPSEQPTTSPHVLIATWNLTCGERLPYEMAQLVGPYQDSSCAVLSLLIKHGGYNHSPGLDRSRNGIPLVQELNYYDYSGNARSMVVQREITRDQNGCSINIPYVTCHQYFHLYNSMLHIRPNNIRGILNELLAELQPAIVNRAAVQKWYECLPADDERVACNPRHSNFLTVLRSLEHFIAIAFKRNRLQLIRLE